VRRQVADADERTRLTAVIADLDKRIRATGAQVIAGVLDQEDAVAMNAPLREQRDLAKLQLGALPGCNRAHPRRSQHARFSRRPGGISLPSGRVAIRSITGAVPGCRERRRSA